jgi:hypothetical protein
MKRGILGWLFLIWLFTSLIGCNDASGVPPAPTVMPPSVTLPLQGATATPTRSPRVTATEQPTSPSEGRDNRFTVYGFRTEGPIGLNSFSAFELPSGREVHMLPLASPTQGAAFALSSQTGRAYVLAPKGSDWQLDELVLPTMQVVKRTSLTDVINLLGTDRVLAVSMDGKEVYAETARITGPVRWDPQLQVGQPDTAYGIAVYGVAQGAFVRSISLEPPWCGVASLFALADGQLLVWCPTAHDLRWLDTQFGRQVATLGVSGVGGVLSPDRHVFWIVTGNAHLFEIDVAKRAISWTSDLSDGLAPIVPYQQLHVSSDGKLLFVRAAPGPEELWRQGLATVVWTLETTTFHHIADVRLPTPAYDFIPSPDGRLLGISTLNWEKPSERGLYVMDTATGRELSRWPWMLIGMQVSEGGG